MRPLVTILLPALFAGVAACSYDWEIGSPSGDGGAGPDAGAGGGGTGGGSGGADAGPSCADLLAKLADARAAAKSCSFGVAGQCDAAITDECGCASYVTHGGSAEASAFAAAVQAVKDAGCSTSCASCLVTAGACLFSAGVPVCVP